MPGILLASGSKKMAGGGTGYYDAVIALSPLVYWRLGESSGLTALDETSNNIDGTYTSVSLGATSCLGTDADTAVDFTGNSNAEATVSSVSGLPTGTSATWSFIFWHRTSARVSLSHYFGFGDYPNASASGNGARRGMLCFNSNYYFWGENSDWDTGVTFHQDSADHFVAVTSDGTSLRLYIDGSLAAGPQTIPYAATAGTSVTVGSHHTAGASPDAVIDECAIFTTTLSSGDISDLWTAGA